MTRDEGVALIKQQLAFKTGLDTSIVEYMKLAQITLEKGPTKPWFLVSEDTFTLTVAGEERVSLPLDFLEEVDEAVFKYRPDTYPTDKEVDLWKEDYDSLRTIFKEVPAGPPRAYALLGEYFRLFPTPDAAYTIRLIYFAKALVLDTNIENKWLKEVPLLLLGTAGQMMTTPLRDSAAKSTFAEWIAAGLKVLHGHDTSRDMANQVLQMGGQEW